MTITYTTSSASPYIASYAYSTIITGLMTGSTPPSQITIVYTSTVPFFIDEGTNLSAIVSS